MRKYYATEIRQIKSIGMLSNNIKHTKTKVHHNNYVIKPVRLHQKCNTRQFNLQIVDVKTSNAKQYSTCIYIYTLV